MVRKLILRCDLSPGDIFTLTVVVHSLHTLYPHQYLTDVRSPCGAIFENSPHITPIDDSDPAACTIRMEYPDIHSSDQRPLLFMSAYCRFLGAYLNVPLEPVINRPIVYLTDEEKSRPRQVDVPYWIVNAGIKNDFTNKSWPIEHYQQVVDSTRGKIKWVQIGEACHSHPALRDVIDLRGKTTLRECIILVHHSSGGLGPVTMLQHACAAFDKTYICILGGREGNVWTSYARQHTLHTIGQLPCCQDGGCWKSRVVKLNDGDHKDNDLCQHPITELQRPSPKCMHMIKPAEVVAVLERMIQ